MIGKRLRKIIEQLILIYCILKEKKICPTYISNINLNCEKKKLLLIPNEEKEGWHYLAVKNLSNY